MSKQDENEGLKIFAGLGIFAGLCFMLASVFFGFGVMLFFGAMFWIVDGNIDWKKWASEHWIISTLFALIILMFCINAINMALHVDDNNPAANINYLNPGEQGIFYLENDGYIVLSYTENGYGQYVDAVVAGNEEYRLSLVYSDNFFIVESGIRVLDLEYVSMGVHKYEILEGPYEGHVGYAAYERGIRR